MPTYRDAVDDFARRSANMEALGKGVDALKGSLRETLPSSKDLMRKTPEAFAEWAKTASPDEVEMAKSGILGSTKLAFGLPGWTKPMGRRALRKAPSLLRSADPNDLDSNLARYGLLGVNSGQ